MRPLTLRSNDRGFTFWHLVAMVVVTGIFVSIFAQLTATNEGGRYWKKAQCLSNVRELEFSLSLYADDSDDHLPKASTWSDDIASYVQDGRIHVCPAVTIAGPEVFGHAFYRPIGHRKTSEFPAMEFQPVLFDSTDLSWNANGLLDSIPRGGRHAGGKSTIGLLDGHAKLMTRYELYETMRAATRQ